MDTAELFVRPAMNVTCAEGYDDRASTACGNLWFFDLDGRSNTPSIEYVDLLTGQLHEREQYHFVNVGDERRYSESGNAFRVGWPSYASSLEVEPLADDWVMVDYFLCTDSFESSSETYQLWNCLELRQ